MPDPRDETPPTRPRRDTSGRFTIVAASGLPPEQQAAHDRLNAEIRRAAGRSPDDQQQPTRADPSGHQRWLIRRIFRHVPRDQPKPTSKQGDSTDDR
jgi:hypothetical protein